MTGKFVHLSHINHHVWTGLMTNTPQRRTCELHFCPSFGHRCVYIK